MATMPASQGVTRTDFLADGHRQHRGAGHAATPAGLSVVMKIFSSVDAEKPVWGLEKVWLMVYFDSRHQGASCPRKGIFPPDVNRLEGYAPSAPLCGHGR